MDYCDARKELRVKVMDLNSSWVDYLQYREEEVVTLTVGGMKKQLSSTLSQKQFDSQTMKLIYNGRFLRNDEALLVDLVRHFTCLNYILCFLKIVYLTKSIRIIKITIFNETVRYGR